MRLVPFRAPLKIRFGDIDHAGIVYYPRFLHFFHVALEELFSEAVGMEYAEVIDDRGVGFPTVRLEIDFHRPLRFGDHIEVEVGVERIGDTSITWTYRVFKRGEAPVVAQARVVTVCLDMEFFAKTPVPDWLRAALAPHAT